MRTIKFRAWEKDRKIMIPEIEFFWGKFEKIGYFEVEGTHDGNAELNQETSTNFELMQFTGLLDKNGKEIYEGDIVSNEHVKLEVNWQLGCFYVGTEPPIRLSEVSHTMEIIGNVWENPELTK